MNAPLHNGQEASPMQQHEDTLSSLIERSTTVLRRLLPHLPCCLSACIVCAMFLFSDGALAVRAAAAAAVAAAAAAAAMRPGRGAGRCEPRISRRRVRTAAIRGMPGRGKGAAEQAGSTIGVAATLTILELDCMRTEQKRRKARLTAQRVT